MDVGVYLPAGLPCCYLLYASGYQVEDESSQNGRSRILGISGG